MAKELSGLQTLINEVEQSVLDTVNSTVRKELAEVSQQIERLSKHQPIAIQIKDTEHTVTGLRHKQLGGLVKVIGTGMPVMMVGMAGTGKTNAASQVADALGQPFYCQSVGAQTSKSDLLGYMDANGKYVPSLFRKAYEQGGVFCMDEIDAGKAVGDEATSRALEAAKGYYKNLLSLYIPFKEALPGCELAMRANSPDPYAEGAKIAATVKNNGRYYLLDILATELTGDCYDKLAAKLGEWFVTILEQEATLTKEQDGRAL